MVGGASEAVMSSRDCGMVAEFQSDRYQHILQCVLLPRGFFDSTRERIVDTRVGGVGEVL